MLQAATLSDYKRTIGRRDKYFLPREKKVNRVFPAWIPWQIISYGIVPWRRQVNPWSLRSGLKDKVA